MRRQWKTKSITGWSGWPTAGIGELATHDEDVRGLLIGHQRGWPGFAAGLLGLTNVALGGVVVVVEALAAH